MDNLLKRLVQLVPDVWFMNFAVVCLQAVYFRGSIFSVFSRSLNGFILRNKIRSHPLSQYVDKIEAKKYITDILGASSVPAVIDIVEGEILDLPPGPWIFKSSHDCSGGVGFTGNRLIDFKGVVLGLPLREPTHDEIVRVLAQFAEKTRQNNHFYTTREACYKSIKPRYFFEAFLLSRSGRSMDEVKVHCILGAFKMAYLVIDRAGENKRAIVDRGYNKIEASWCKPRDLYKYQGVVLGDPPGCWESLIKDAEKLSKKFRYVRVDFYVDNDRYFVGELTFFHGSGLEELAPSTLDKALGEDVSKRGLR